MQTWVTEIFDILFLKCVPEILQGEVFALASRYYTDIKNIFLWQNEWHSRAVFTQRIATQAPPVLLYLMARSNRARLKLFGSVHPYLTPSTFIVWRSVLWSMLADPALRSHSIHLGVHLPHCLWKEIGWIPKIRKTSLWRDFVVVQSLNCIWLWVGSHC